ncbi:flagellar hook-associated protein FlgK [Algicella marina]|uniref:Flagellar hook-associated protein 1 n=1 Tax=Algicella marina TaxID=2683284 RepID=A0A6P1T0B8_9RHOB|nr:flagellar hook-associated protein FlgK [Algicella marina]QHQ36364.1 flagellar hook-associated protein FlgK [Algicella marina]
MSISSALTNALSGLNAASRSAEIIANNIANAQTPGYTRRSVELVATQVNGRGTGVTVAGVTLNGNAVTLANRRLADAEAGFAGAQTGALSRLTEALGLPGDDYGLASAAADFLAALTGSANDPASAAGQAALASTAKTYAKTINDVANTVREVRQDADAEIARQVTSLNDGLRAIEKLNADIKSLAIAGNDTSSLVDTRNQVIDSLSSIVPLRIVQRDYQSIAVFTREGGVLLDPSARELDFTASGLITPDMTLSAGSLSELSQNGQAVRIGDGTGTGRLDGGSLSALFEIRDVVTPAFNDKLDALAQDLIQRFEDPALDPTLAPGDAGLFTDNGSAYDALNQIGLARRISLNSAVDPAAGGDLWRLRDGINAAAQGNVSSSAILGNLLSAATSLNPAPAALEITPPVTVASIASELTSGLAATKLQSERLESHASAYLNTLREAESGQSGVDTDAEIQQLILVEQAYAANARVISVTDELISRLLEI